MTKKVALYARVSTANQGTGLEAQVRALRDYCSRMQIEDYVLYQDENQSGTKASRPALDRMMEGVRRGDYNTVAVYSFSRYARSTQHLLRALEEFRQFGVAFISISENIDTSSALGTAIFTILGAVAQLERDILAERVRNGLANAKAKGIHIGRKKTRPSELIRTLRRSGLSYSAISAITRVSEGAIGAELSAWRDELARQSRTIADEMAEHKAEKPKTDPAAKAALDALPGVALVHSDIPLKLELVR
jgi:DNA invertase Pin-like site-specific DNA recombinase